MGDAKIQQTTDEALCGTYPACTFGRPIEQEFDAYLACGRLKQSFLRVRCERCRVDQPAATSYKNRGICSSCGARRCCAEYQKSLEVGRRN